MEEKEEKYDSIDDNTASLFEESAKFRLVVLNGLPDVTGAYKDGKYSPDINATWRNSDAYQKAYVDAVLNKDEKNVTVGEYSQIVLMLTNAPKDDPSLFQHLLCNKNCWEFVDHNYSEIETDSPQPSYGGFKASAKLETIQRLLRMEVNLETMAATADSDNTELSEKACKLSQYNQIIDQISKNYDKFSWDYMMNSNQEEEMLDYISSDYIKLSYKEGERLEAQIKDDNGGFNTLSAEKVKFSSDAFKSLADTEHYYINRYLGIDSNTPEDDAKQLGKDVFDKYYDQIASELLGNIVDYAGGELLEKLISSTDFAMMPYNAIVEYAEEKEKETKIKYYENLGSLVTLSDVFSLGCGVSHYTYNGSEQVPSVTVYPQTNGSGKTTQDLVNSFNNMMKEDDIYKKMANDIISSGNISDEYKSVLQGDLTMEYLLNNPNEVNEILNMLAEIREDEDEDDYSKYRNTPIDATMGKY